MKLTLLIPHLLLPRAQHDWQNPYRDLALPSLERLFARGRLTHGTAMSLETCLGQRFGIKGEVPVAAFSRLSDGLDVDTQYYLRADPVYLQAQREQLMLIEGGQLTITAEEAAALINTLNHYFAQDGFQFLAGAPDRWYIALPNEPNLITHALPEVAGQGLNAYMPAGSDALLWHKRVTEAQMLLHTHPVNAAREARGAPLINSVWLWGGGRTCALRQSDSTVHWADDALTRGLALSAGSVTHVVPATVETLLSEAHSDSEHVVVWDKLRAAAAYGDYEAWRAGVLSLEKDWVRPALLALRQGRLHAIEIQALMPTETLQLAFTRGSSWRFWRRKQNLKHYAVNANT